MGYGHRPGLSDPNLRHVSANHLAGDVARRFGLRQSGPQSRERKNGKQHSFPHSDTPRDTPISRHSIMSESKQSSAAAGRRPASNE